MKKKTSTSVLLRVILLILVLAIIYSGLQILVSTVLQSPASTEGQTGKKTIVRDGVEYFPRQDITVVMVLGIDQSGPVQASKYYRNEGAADSIMLLIFDEATEECTVLYLNRDTMLTMDALGIRGEYAGTTYGQLALAHTYGTGLEDSCVNTKNTLMNYLHGMTIDYYLAMNMDAIPILNDAVGGVTVTVTDDFSKVNPSITMGEVTLRGQQVIDYVRTRKDVGDQKNVTRMARQQQYVSGFLKALEAKGNAGVGFALRLYEQLSPYIVTDCSAETLDKIISQYLDYTLAGTITPEGESRIEDGYYAFYADEEALDALCVELFYRPKK